MIFARRAKIMLEKKKKIVRRRVLSLLVEVSGVRCKEEERMGVKTSCIA